MNEQKKSIIVNEIHFWKQNQMLPEYYCDFLLALYEQEEQGKTSKKRKTSILNQRSINRLVLWQLTLVFVTIVALILLFVSTTLWLTLLVGLTMVVLLTGFSFYFVKRSMKTPVMYVLIALILLGVSFKVWLLYFSEQPTVLVMIMLVHCVLWITAGKVLKQVYFVISGIAGVLIALYFLFF